MEELERSGEPFGDNNSIVSQDKIASGAKKTIPELISNLIEPIVKLSEQLSSVEIEGRDSDEETNLEIKTTVNAWTKKKKPTNAGNSRKAGFETLINDVGNETKQVQTDNCDVRGLSTSTTSLISRSGNQGKQNETLNQSIQAQPECLSAETGTDMTSDHFIINLKHQGNKFTTSINSQHEKTVQTNDEDFRIGNKNGDISDLSKCIKKLLNASKNEESTTETPKSIDSTRNLNSSTSNQKYPESERMYDVVQDQLLPNKKDTLSSRSTLEENTFGVMEEEEFARLLSRRLDKLSNSNYYPVESKLEDSNTIKILESPEKYEKSSGERHENSSAKNNAPTSAKRFNIEENPRLKPGSTVVLKEQDISEELPKLIVHPAMTTDSGGFSEPPLDLYNLVNKKPVFTPLISKPKQMSSVEIFKMLTKDPEQAKYGLQSCLDDEINDEFDNSNPPMNNRRLYTVMELPESSRSSMSDVASSRKEKPGENGTKCRSFMQGYSTAGSRSINSETSSMSGVGMLGAYKTGDFNFTIGEENLQDYSQV